MGKKKSKSGQGAGGRRPRRQRTQVQHYTDDIPGTFTKKKKRRRGEFDSSDSSSEEEHSGHHQPAINEKRHIHFDEFAHAADVAAAESSSSSAKSLKRKRPPKAVAELTINSGVNTASKGSTQQLQLHPRKLQEKPAPPAPKTTLLSHTASVAPVLPVATTCPLARHSLAQQYPVVFGRGLGAPQPPTRPEWSLIPQHDFYFPEDYYEVKVNCTPASEDEDPRTALAPVLQSAPWPVCRVVTSVCSYSDWMAVGDSAGFILLYGTVPSTIKPLTRLDTSASKREHARQRKTQAELENRCRHKPELLENRSPFWATAKTPNAIQGITWTKNLILCLTSQEIEALELSSGNTHWDTITNPSKARGGSQHCKILWTLPVATVGGPRKNGSNSLLKGGELVGSALELHKKGTMVVWNTWGVAAAKKDPKKTQGDDTATETQSNDSQEAISAEDDWPLLLLREPGRHLTSNESPNFIQIIPFQRNEEEEKPPPVPIKRSPGRPPKKKPKPKIPVTKSELVWTEHSKCHAAMWDNHVNKGDRLVIAYSAATGTTTSEAHVQLALLKLTDDIGTEDVSEGLATAAKNQYAKLLQQIAIPLTGSARNASVPEVTLQQSTKGTYTLVAGSRGVRMYQTETMALLRVYGENVSLHGKTMVWKSCFVVDNKVQQRLYQQQQEQLDPTYTSMDDDGDDSDNDESSSAILRQNRQGFVWIEQENPAAALTDTRDAGRPNSGKMITRGQSSMQRIRTSSSADELEESDDEDDESTWLHQAWIVGIPHPFRGPKELQETLYFWQGVEKLPLFTLPLPQQCGGVQSMLPLSSGAGSSGSRDGGMWLRLMVATVHGECMQLAPAVKSDFPGTMYNPGYLVVRDNVEYIEDEDELDKIMVEVREEESEEEESVLAPPLGSKVGGGGDIVDEELQEAIRLSLLETTGNSEKKESDDEDEEEGEEEIVVVQDYFGDDDSDLVIPPEPEPFLRQKVLPDYESENLLTVGEMTDGGDISAKDAEFASEVLSILPQAQVSQEMWEKQKCTVPPKDFLTIDTQMVHDKAPPTNGTNQVAVAPAAGKQGKAKRTRAGNLETTLKASIVPGLRQYMTDRALCWADGGGASLQGDAWDDAVSLKPKSGVGKNSPRPTTLSLPKPATAVERAAAEVIRRSTGNEGGLLSNDSMNGGPSAAGGALMVRVPETRKEVEKEIAMELLQLSPRPKMAADPLRLPKESTELLHIPEMQQGLINAAKEDGSGIQIAIIELKDYSGLAEQYSCTGTVAIPLTLEECGIEVDTGDGDGTALEQGRSSPEENSEPMEGVEMTSKGKTSCKEEGTLGRARCAACQGRMVIHSCGKRALPIDFEAIARAEKAKKDREEEEKKRLKVEKRKQADAKRREAKRLKKEREKREKIEKEAEMRRMREAKVAEARANMANIGDCIETSDSPRLNGVSEVQGASQAVGDVKLPQVAAAASRGTDPVHFAIADAWKQHAEKFTAKIAKPTDVSVAHPAALQPSTLDALATMAEAATPHGHSPNQASLTSATNGSMISAPQASNDVAAPPGQQRAGHGFLSAPNTAEPSAAMIARRNQVLNSYHAIEAGGVRVLDLSAHNRAALQGALAHSFQISPMSNSNRGRGGFQRRSTTGALPAAAARAGQPYFGYTQISTNFRPTVNLGTYSNSAIFTRPHGSPPPTRTENEAPARAPVVAPNRDAYFPGSQAQPQAAVALNPAPAVASVQNAVGWMQARAAAGTALSQPRLGQPATPSQVMEAAVAQYHLHQRGVQPGPSAAPAAATMNANGVVYHQKSPTTNP